MSDRSADERGRPVCIAEPIDVPGLEHEQKLVLGYVLTHKDGFEIAVELQADDFFPSSYGTAWSAAVKLHRRGLCVDEEAVVAALGKKRLHALGNRAFIQSLTEGRFPYAPRIAQAVANIKANARRRRAQLAAEKYTKQLAAGVDPDEALRALLDSTEARAQKFEASRARLVRLSDVAAKPVPWLWKPYLPLGMLAMLTGDSEVGKSYVCQAIAAGLTLGQLPCGGGPCEPCSVLHFTVENSAEYTLRPRFDSLGGNASRYWHCAGSEWTDEQGVVHYSGITLADIGKLDDALIRSEAKLVLIDPIVSFLPAKTDAHRANEIRQLLDPLAKLAEKHMCCIVLIRHMNKGVGGKAIYRGSMSIDFTAAVRSEMLVGYLPDDRQKRAIVHVMHNVGPGGPTVGFAIDPAGEFSWTGPSDITAAQLLADPTSEPARVGPALKEACEWLTDFLTPDSQSQAECVKAAENNDISFATLKRAKARLGVKSQKASFKGAFIWSLPKAAHPPIHSEPVETLREKKQEPEDLDRFKGVEPLGAEESILSRLEGTKSNLSHFIEKDEVPPKKSKGLSRFVNDNNNKDLSIDYPATKDEGAQPAQGTSRAREDFRPNGFDPVN